MKYSLDHIEDLITKFVAGQTSEAEEQLLADFFASSDDVPAEWQAYRELFLSFGTDAYDLSDAEIDAMLTPSPEPKARAISFWPWLTAACAAAVLALVVLRPWADTSTPVTPPAAMPVAHSTAVTSDVSDATQPPADNPSDTTTTVAETSPMTAVLKTRPRATVTHRADVMQSHDMADLLAATDILADELIDVIDLIADAEARGIVVSAIYADMKVSYVVADGPDGNTLELNTLTTKVQ